MSFDEIFDLTAGVYFNFYNIYISLGTFTPAEVFVKVQGFPIFFYRSCANQILAAQIQFSARGSRLYLTKQKTVIMSSIESTK